MKRTTIILALVLIGAGCKAPQFTMGGEKNDVALSYRWNHRDGQPSELLVKIANKGAAARTVQFGLDVYRDSFTVEHFAADTCIPAGRTFNGKLNGIYFVCQALSPEEAAGPNTQVSLTAFQVEQTDACP